MNGMLADQDRAERSDTVFATAVGVIGTRLDDVMLDAAAVASELHVSVRTLHRAFARNGTSFGACLRRMRLQRCRDDLIDPRSAPATISVIAARWGITDPSHFSRLYKAQFGVRPRETRRAS